MAKKFNGTIMWTVRIALIVLLASIPAFVTFGRNSQRLDHHDAAIEKKADKVVVDLHYEYIKEQLAVISKQIAELKDG